MVEGRIEARRRRRLVQHLAECDGCALLWSHLVEVVASPHGHGISGIEGASGSTTGVRGASGRPDGSPSRGKTGRRHAGFAAAVAILCGVAISLLVTPVPSPDALRGASTTSTIRVVVGSEDGAPVLSWTSWPGAEAYRVRLWDGRGRLVREVELPAGRHRYRPRSESRSGDAYGDLVGVVQALAGGRVVATGDVVEVPAPGEPAMPPERRPARMRRDRQR